MENPPSRDKSTNSKSCLDLFIEMRRTRTSPETMRRDQCDDQSFVSMPQTAPVKRHMRPLRAWESAPITPLRKSTPKAAGNTLTNNLIQLTQKYFTDPTGMKEARLIEHEYLFEHNKAAHAEVLKLHNHEAYSVIHNNFMLDVREARLHSSRERIRWTQDVEPRLLRLQRKQLGPQKSKLRQQQNPATPTISSIKLNDTMATIRYTLDSQNPSEAKRILRKAMQRSQGLVQHTEFQKIIELAGDQIRTSAENRVFLACLRRLAAFSFLADFVIVELSTRFELINFSKDSKIELGHWYLVVHGSVRIVLSNTSPESRINVWRLGEYFGHEVLTTDLDKYQIAIAEENSIVLKLNHDDFRHYVLPGIRGATEDVFHYLKTVPIFKNVNLIGLRYIADRVAVQKFAPHSVIMKQGVRNGSIVVLRKGTCNLYRTITVVSKYLIVMQR